MHAVAELIALLRAQETTDEAVEALSELGAQVLEPLVEVMLDTSESNRVREIAAQCVGRIVPEGVRRLLSMLTSTQGNDADLAAWGLRFHHDHAVAEPELFSMLTSPLEHVRANAARALRYIHVDLKACDSRLLCAVRDKNPSVRSDALRTLTDLADVGLSRYGIKDASSVSMSARAVLDDPDVAVRQRAERLLDQLDGLPMASPSSSAEGALHVSENRHSPTWCHTYFTADVPTKGLFQIQWQFPAFTYNCTANSLQFAPLVLAFIAETRGNPACRDIPLGGGVYKYMDEKVLDLSRFFLDIRLLFQKLGEGDDSYLLKIEHASDAWLRFRLSWVYPIQWAVTPPYWTKPRRHTPFVKSCPSVLRNNVIRFGR